MLGAAYRIFNRVHVQTDFFFIQGIIKYLLHNVRENKVSLDFNNTNFVHIQKLNCGF